MLVAQDVAAGDEVVPAAMSGLVAVGQIPEPPPGRAVRNVGLAREHVQGRRLVRCDRFRPTVQRRATRRQVVVVLLVVGVIAHDEHRAGDHRHPAPRRSRGTTDPLQRHKRAGGPRHPTPLQLDARHHLERVRPASVTRRCRAPGVFGPRTRRQHLPGGTVGGGVGEPDWVQTVPDVGVRGGVSDPGLDIEKRTGNGSSKIVLPICRHEQRFR